MDVSSEMVHSLLPLFLVAVLGASATRVGVIEIVVREPRVAAAHSPRSPLRRSEICDLDAGFWLVMAFGALLSLARVSEAFLLLRARDVGVADAYAPALLAAMNVAYFLTAYPAGNLSDRIGRGGLLAGASWSWPPRA